MKADPDRTWIEKFRVWLQDVGGVLALFFLHLGIFLAVLVMIGLLAVGFYDLGKAVLLSFGPPPSDDKPGSHPLYLAIKGIEYFFLSPLPLLVLQGLFRYVSVFVEESDGAGHVGQLDELHAREKLLTAKSFTIALLAAAVATALVGEVVSKRGINIEIAAGGCLVLLAMVGLLIVIQREEQTVRMQIREESERQAKTKDV